MRITIANNVAHHVREEGDPAGRAIVFANSLGTDLRLWNGIIPLLPKGLRLIRYDKRGHGLSDVPDGPYEMKDLISDAEALLENLGIRSCVFVGISIGGMIAQGLAAHRPDLVRAAVLSNTAGRMGDPAMWQDRIDAVHSGGIAAIADTVLERWFSPAFVAGPELTGWKNLMLRTPVEGYTGCCAALAGADLRQTTAALTLPVLGIAGELDGSSPPALVEATVNSIAGSRMVTLPGTGHLPHVEAPQAYAGLLTEFIRESGDP